MTAPPGPGSGARELRREFDRAFASAAVDSREPTEDLLRLTVLGDPYAIRISKISGIVPARKLVRIPARAPGLLGLVGLHGALVPVFQLSTLLGYEDRAEAHRWLVLVGTEDRVGLAVGEVERYLRVPSSALVASEDAEGRRFLDEIAATPEGSCSVIDLGRVIETLRSYQVGR